MNKDILYKLTKSRSQLILDHCFWGVLAIRLKLREDTSCDTAATDGETLLYNPKYINGLTPKEITGLEAHEVMHCAMGDIWRLDNRNPFIWNMACDFVNNIILTEAKFTLPKGALYDLTYRGMSKEEVYNILMNLPRQLQGQGVSGQKHKDPGKCGSMFKPADPTKAKQAEVEWKLATVQAANMSQGTIPASLRQRISDEVVDPPLPWYILLRDFVQRTARNDYNWNRPSRRHLFRNIILPSLINDELPMSVVVVDTSASTHAYLSRFANEASGVLGSFNTTILVMYCDARAYPPIEYKTEDLPIKLEPQGGGGTDFRPPFDYIEKEGITPACLIYLTDMYGTFPQNEPEYPVMWVSVSKDEKAPWGETVLMDNN
jgi:predicted metal-dependent peptidase